MSTNTSTNPLHDARRITPCDREWPDQLDQLHPPVAELWVTGAGDLREALEVSVTITGARACTSYGRQVSTDLGQVLASEGWGIVTGGGFGIDAAAVRGALTVRQAPVVIVAAAGLNHVHPIAHQSMFASVLAAGGLIVSEYSPDTRPNRDTFRRRNQLLGALACGVVIVEAAARSFSRLAVDAAEAIGAPVFAVPGPVTSALSHYPHELIRADRAILATSADQIKAEYGH